MGRDLYDRSPAAREIFEAADEVLGRAISRLCFEGSEAQMRATVNTQPALYVVSAAALAALRAAGVEGAMAAGHSLGEYTALYAAGALDFATGLKLVDARARAMEEASRERPGTMAAVLGLDSERVEEICRSASTEGVVVAANWNSPGQVVLSGERAAVARAIELARSSGAKKAIELNVGGAFHSPLMAGAAERLRDAVAGAAIRKPRLRFVANFSGSFLSDPALIAHSLIEQLTSCVLWMDCVKTMAAAGAAEVIEVGPGNVLTGLARRIEGRLKRYNVSEMKDVQKLEELVAS